MVRTKDFAADSALRTGLLVPYSARAGSTWYASQIKRCFPESNVIVFAEDQLEPSPGTLRCWHRASRDFSRLEQAIKKESIKILHIVGFRPFFETNAFVAFLRKQKSQGVHILFDVFDSLRGDRDS